jgi:hypothetical protein
MRQSIDVPAQSDLSAPQSQAISAQIRWTTALICILLLFPRRNLCQEKYMQEYRPDKEADQRLSNNLFNTTVAEISRLAASGITIDCGLSITSSVTIIFRLTGRQCMKKALLVTPICRSLTVHCRSRLKTCP